MIRHTIRHWILWMVLVFSGTVTAYPQTAASLPELSTTRLLNGLQIIVAPTPQFDRKMAIGLVVRYGSAFDSANKSGVANFLSRMFLKATDNKTGDNIREELKNLGVTLEIQCDWDGYKFLLKGDSATFERSLLLLYEIVCEAQFPEDDLKAMKQQLIEELQQAPDPRLHLREMFEKVLFGGTTYGRTIEGTSDSIKNLTSGDLRYFYSRYFSPNAASLVITGNMAPSEVLERASRIWGLWIRKDPIPFTFAPSRGPVADIHLIEDNPDSSAVEFILGNFSPPRQDPQYSNVTVAARILQQRLRKLLPTSLLTVGVDSRRMPGAFYIQGQAAADEAIDQILAIEESMDAMKRTPVSAEELAEAQNSIIEEFDNKLKTVDGMCTVILDTELFRLGSYYMTAFQDYIRNCDEDYVRQVARDYFFPGKKIVILRGPMKDLMQELKRLGTFKQIAS